MVKSGQKELNAKEQAFVKEYLVDLNAMQAAIRAGYAPQTAHKQAYAWIGNNRQDCPENKRHVWDAVNKAKEERSERVKVDSDYVLRRLVEIDSMDVLDILSDDGSIKPITKWPKVWRTSISAIDLSEIFETQDSQKELVGVLKKIKWPDKTKNLELLGKHVDVQSFKEQHKHSGTVVIFDCDYS